MEPASEDKKELILDAIEDPAYDWLQHSVPRSASKDIRAARIWLVDGKWIRLEMILNEKVPLSPLNSRAYGWLLDTDLNAGTGMKINDIGGDYFVKLIFDSRRSSWNAVMFDMINTNRISVIYNVQIRDERLFLSIPLAALRNPPRINWVSLSQDDYPPYFIDKLPDRGHVSTLIHSF